MTNARGRKVSESVANISGSRGATTVISAVAKSTGPDTVRAVMVTLPVSTPVAIPLFESMETFKGSDELKVSSRSRQSGSLGRTLQRRTW